MGIPAIALAGAGFAKGLIGGGAGKPRMNDTRLPPTVIDMFSQAGLTGSDRASFLNPLMPTVRQKLYEAFGVQAPSGPNDVFNRLINERINSAGIGNSAALGQDPAREASSVERFNRGLGALGKQAGLSPQEMAARLPSLQGHVGPASQDWTLNPMTGRLERRQLDPASQGA